MKSPWLGSFPKKSDIDGGIASVNRRQRKPRRSLRANGLRTEAASRVTAALWGPAVNVTR